jgi:MinD-like ATPase involved in chromosome partitioning or flagellar assembly
MPGQEDRNTGDWQGDVFREMRGGGRGGVETARPVVADSEAAVPPKPEREPEPSQPEPERRPVPDARAEPWQQSWSEPRPEWPPPTATPARRPAAPVAVPAPVVAPGLDPAPSRIRHGDPLPRRALNAARRLLASSSARDTELLADAARLIQQPITTGRQIAVTSIRGGAGKSTVAALLALTFGHFRPDPVLAVESDAILGTLPHRLGAREVRWSCGDLARILKPSMRITDVTGYLVPFAGGWLLPGSRGAVDGPLDAQTYWTVMTSLRRYFGTTVVDCETLPAEVARLALATTQARVLVAPATAEGVATTRWVLDWVAGINGESGMLATTVVALARTSPDMVIDERQAAAQLEVGGARMVSLPYDRSLAAGGEIRTALLGQGTRDAVARLAAEAMDRAVAHGRAAEAGS